MFLLTIQFSRIMCLSHGFVTFKKALSLSKLSFRSKLSFACDADSMLQKSDRAVNTSRLKKFHDFLL